MNKLTIIRFMASIGMVLFFVFGLANWAAVGADDYPMLAGSALMLAGAIIWAFFGMWARRVARQPTGREDA